MFTIALMYTVLFKLCPTRSTTIQKATHYQRNHRQGEDDEEDDEEDDDKKEEKQEGTVDVDIVSVNGFQSQTQTYIDQLQVLKGNIRYHIEEKIKKEFGGDSTSNNNNGSSHQEVFVAVTHDDDDVNNDNNNVNRGNNCNNNNNIETEIRTPTTKTADDQIHRLEYLLIKKNIELYTTKAQLRVSERKLLATNNNDNNNTNGDGSSNSNRNNHTTHSNKQQEYLSFPY
mmetsp:Transcript_38595/g.41873  ORF Transcript_38595/g.41873 Transcript_38595/m.41873 type:complete len:228 (-) Transcript_38595:530-1213(-)